MAGLGIDLVHVVGNAIHGTSSVAQHPHNHHLVAYPAGSCVVLHDTKCDTQQVLSNCSKQHDRNKRLSCVAFSPCGLFVAAGEMGADPVVSVWRTDSLKCMCQPTSPTRPTLPTSPTNKPNQQAQPTRPTRLTLPSCMIGLCLVHQVLPSLRLTSTACALLRLELQVPRARTTLQARELKKTASYTCGRCHRANPPHAPHHTQPRTIRLALHQHRRDLYRVQHVNGVRVQWPFLPPSCRIATAALLHRRQSRFRSPPIEPQLVCLPCHSRTMARTL
jgi:hypothetical protein